MGEAQRASAVGDLETATPVGILHTYRMSALAAAPGLVTLIVLWFLTFRRLDYAGLVEGNYGLWQSLGREILSQDPVAGLMSLHIQPPGLNMLKALDLLVTPTSHWTLAALFLLMVAGSLWMIVDTLMACGLGPRSAALAGLIYAVLPATVIYSLWPFTTTPTMFGAALAIWGVARLRLQPILGLAAACGGAFALMVTRSSFVWVFLLCWVLGLAVVVTRSATSRRIRGWQIATIAGTLAAAFALQAHYWTSFGLTTMSSWTGENLARALSSSGALTVTPEAREKIRQDTCEASVLDSLLTGNPVIWKPAEFRSLPGCSELPHLAERGTAAWDSPVKDGSFDGAFTGNFNWSDRLVASRVWSAVMQEIVSDRPSQLIAVAIATPTGARQSALGIYLGPAEDYTFVTAIRDQYPVPQVGGTLSLLFAPAMLTLATLGLAVSVARRHSNPGAALTLGFAVGLLGYHLAVSTLVEHGENMRFQAEVYPVLLVAGFLGFSALRSSTQTRAST